MPLTSEDVKEDIELTNDEAYAEYKMEGMELTAIERKTGKRYLIEVKVYPLELC